jgi:hypothetical protein
MQFQTIDQSLDRMAFSALWASENLLGRTLGARMVRPLKDKVEARVRQSTIPAAMAEIDRLDGFSAEVFERDYYRRGRPVVFAGAARDWRCVREWSPDFFRERYGSSRVEVGDDRYSDRGGTVDTLPLSEAVPMLQQSSVRYIRFSSFLGEHPELVEMLDARFRRDVRRFMLTKGATQMFMGNAGTSTELHAAMTNNMFVQVYGQKDWILVHPSHSALCKPVCENSPTFRSDLSATEVKKLPGLHALLQPGDILYLPPFYWHYVMNPTFSIGVAYRWLAVVPSLRTSSLMALLTLLATNPSPFLFLFDIKRGQSAPHFFRRQKAAQ